MGLRALALVVFLGLHSGMGAFTGLLHLCQDEVRLRANCCCGHGEQAKEPGCCDASVVQPERASALASSEGRWELPERALLPPPPVLAPPPAPESLPEAWVRTEGIRRSTAPPLYLQNCSYLI